MIEELNRLIVDLKHRRGRHGNYDAQPFLQKGSKMYSAKKKRGGGGRKRRATYRQKYIKCKLTLPSLMWWNLKMPHNRVKSDRFHSSGVRPNGMDGKFLFMYNDMEEQGIEPHSRACKIRLKSGQTT